MLEPSWILPLSKPECLQVGLSRKAVVSQGIPSHAKARLQGPTSSGQHRSDSTSPVVHDLCSKLLGLKVAPCRLETPSSLQEPLVAKRSQSAGRLLLQCPLHCP